MQLREQTAGGAAWLMPKNNASQRIFDSLKLVETDYGDAVVERIGTVEARLNEGNCYGPSHVFSEGFMVVV
jgi:hypothetical protein